jgi:DNA-binding winged helix-turn-helix (wHTH) protein/TolB-like protein/Flp pilus assembly protein TadD
LKSVSENSQKPLKTAPGAAPERVFEFGAFRLDAAGRRLLREATPIPLTPRAFETLLLLVRNADRVITKDELMASVWHDAVVEEGNLSQTIFVLRKALGQNGETPQYIETVPRIGYRFACPVTRVFPEPPPIHEIPPPPPSVGGERTLKADRPRRSARSGLFAGAAVLAALAGIAVWLRPSGIGRPIRSLAVLPFHAIGPAQPDDYFGLGLADALITRFGALREIAVRPTSSIRRYTSAPAADALAAGQQLGVDAVLDGEYQRVGDRIRVTVQLVRLPQKTTLWSAKLDERSTDVLTLEDALSSSIAQALAPRLSEQERRRLSRPPSANPEAYEAYLRGRYHWNQRTPEHLRKALALLEEAVARDPAFALAHAAIADSDLLLSAHQVLSPSQAFPRARAAAERAIALDPDLAEPYAALGYASLFYDWNWRDAERRLREALDRDPHDAVAHQWYASWLASLGRSEEGLAEIRRAQELDPLSLSIGTVVATHLYYARRYGEAVDQLRGVLDMDSRYAPAHEVLGMVWEQQGNFSAAIEEFRTLASLTGSAAYAEVDLAHALAASGDAAGSRALLDRLERALGQREIWPSELARVHAVLGENDRAFALFDRAVAERVGDLVWIRVDPRLDALRPDARFAALVARVGIPG